jgi:FXSXX-COOH protein
MDLILHTRTAVTAVTGVADTRGTSLDRLAGDAASAAAEGLRNVLPTEEAGRVPVAAFSSSI